MASSQFQIKKATKKQSRLRLSIQGPAGSGKTYTALMLAQGLGGKIGVIDTERGSASKYADICDFDVIELDDFHPESFINAIRAFEQAGHEIIIIDSTTHEWNGKNGILELHEAAVAKQKTKNSYTAWADVTPLHTAFIDAILGCKAHVIASVRSKVDYVQEKNERGYTEIRKVGMASIQREGMDYEYDIQIEMDVQHNGVITKTRCAALDNKVFKKPGKELADILKNWLTDGAPAEEKKPDLKIVKSETKAESAPLCDEDTQNQIVNLWLRYGSVKNGEIIPLGEYLKKQGVDGIAFLPQERAEKLLTELQKRQSLRSDPQPGLATYHEAVANVDAQLESAPEITPHEALAAARQEWLNLGGKEHSIIRHMDQKYNVGTYAELSDEQAKEMLAWLQKCILDVGVS